MNPNWQPKNFEEFRKAALTGKLDLAYRVDQRPCFQTVLSKSFFESRQTYNQRLIQKMATNEKIYLQVWEKCGADIVCYD